MDSNTMQLATIADPQADETGEPLHQRWHLFSSRAPKKHRIQDLVARLRGDLKRSQDLNEELGAMLKDALEKNVDLTEQVAELTEKLRVAEESNRANTMAVDFDFPQRRIDGPEDQATMPVSQVELLDDGSVRAVAANAATALLERIEAQAKPQLQLVPAYAPPAPTVAMDHALTTTLNDDDKDDYSDDEEPEVFNETSSGWQVRQPAVMRPVTWGQPAPRELRADQSTTGTFRVMSLQQRGTGPTAIPGLTAL